MYDIKPSDIKDRLIVEREDVGELLLGTLENHMHEEISLDVEALQMESVHIGSVIGAIEILMWMNKTPTEIQTIGRAYIIKKTVSRVRDVQALLWNLDYIVISAKKMWRAVGKRMPISEQACTNYVRQILESLIHDLGECEPEKKLPPLEDSHTKSGGFIEG